MVSKYPGVGLGMLSLARTWSRKLLIPHRGWNILPSYLLTLGPAAAPQLSLQWIPCSLDAPSLISQSSPLSFSVRELSSSHFHVRKFASGASADVEPSSDSENAPPKQSVLRPPKQAPSTWQIFFTDWLSHKRASGDEQSKLNVAQEAKEAAKAYSELSEEQQSDLKARAKTLKERYEHELTAWQKSLTREDVERENAFRTAQRKSGKSRRKNIVDTNAPKRPMSAYFLFLQDIRSDPQMVREVFGDETDLPRQSVLAAAKWRSLTDDEKEPYLAKAAEAKFDYEEARRRYEQGIAYDGA